MVDETGIVEAAPPVDLETLFRSHHRALVGLARLLLRDADAAEEVVQDAFLGLHRHRRRLRDSDRAVAFLRSSVVNGTRSRQRRQAVAERHPAEPAAIVEAADRGTIDADHRRQVLAAVNALPDRQRECIVLRFYSELADAEIADALGVSVGSVKTHLHRARAALAESLEEVERDR